MGIIESQTIWSTDLNFLNDASEGKLARQTFQDVLYPHFLEEVKQRIKTGHINADMIEAEGGLEYLVKQEIEIMVNICCKSMGGSFYVTSLCGKRSNEVYERENGMLSQWRGYGPDGGIAFVLNTRKLEEALRMEADEFALSLGMGNALYHFDGEEDDLKEDFSIICENFVNFAMAQFKRTYFGEEAPNDEISKNGYEAVFQGITRLKHQGFKEEKEVRIYSHRLLLDEHPEDKKPKPVKFRVPAVPYIELFSSDKIILPIEKIIVGPHQDKERRAEGLRIMLKEKKMDIKVTISETPYIG